MKYKYANANPLEEEELKDLIYIINDENSTIEERNSAYEYAIKSFFPLALFFVKIFVTISKVDKDEMFTNAMTSIYQALKSFDMLLINKTNITQYIAFSIRNSILSYIYKDNNVRIPRIYRKYNKQVRSVIQVIDEYSINNIDVKDVVEYLELPKNYQIVHDSILQQQVYIDENENENKKVIDELQHDGEKEVQDRIYIKELFDIMKEAIDDSTIFDILCKVEGLGSEKKRSYVNIANIYNKTPEWVRQKHILAKNILKSKLKGPDI